MSKKDEPPGPVKRAALVAQKITSDTLVVPIPENLVQRAYEIAMLEMIRLQQKQRLKQELSDRDIDRLKKLMDTVKVSQSVEATEEQRSKLDHMSDEELAEHALKLIKGQND